MKAIRIGFALLFGSAAALAAVGPASAGDHHSRHRGGWDSRWPEHLPAYLNESLDPSAVDPDGGDMFAGSGNSIDHR